MSNFNNLSFIKHDDYMTPFSAWNDIKEHIPSDKLIWEPFYGNGESGQHLQDLGFTVYHEKRDFFTYDKPDSVVVSNPPFSKTKEVLTKLKNDNRPFILILPSSKINTQYFREIFQGDDELQIIIPKKRINFKRYNGDNEEPRSTCNFDCFYYCYKINLDKSITWL